MKFILGFLLCLSSSMAESKTLEVKMLNVSPDGPMAFSPGFVKADPGDTVKFIPTDVSHSTESVLVPPGATAWKGKPDQSISVKLTAPGVYIAQCQPHALMGMVVVIQVGKPGNKDAVMKEAARMTASFVMNKDRLTKYLAQVNW